MPRNGSSTGMPNVKVANNGGMQACSQSHSRLGTVQQAAVLWVMCSLVWSDQDCVPSKICLN